MNPIKGTRQSSVVLVGIDIKFMDCMHDIAGGIHGKPLVVLRDRHTLPPPPPPPPKKKIK